MREQETKKKREEKKGQKKKRKWKNNKSPLSIPWCPEDLSSSSSEAVKDVVGWVPLSVGLAMPFMPYVIPSKLDLARQRTFGVMCQDSVPAILPLCGDCGGSWLREERETTFIKMSDFWFLHYTFAKPVCSASYTEMLEYSFCSEAFKRLFQFFL